MLFRSRVPTCPDWALSDLAAHVGTFGAWWAAVLCEATGRPKPEVPPVPAGDAVVDWADAALGSLVDELKATPPDAAVWSWVPGHDTARFVARRAAHELAVHRFDAESARGRPTPVDAALAADGIEEIFVMLTAWPRSGKATGQTLHLHGTDRGDEWMITLLADRIDVERIHAKGDLALRAAVSDLELVLYQRPALGELQRFGDESVLDGWYREFIFAG